MDCLSAGSLASVLVVQMGSSLELTSDVMMDREKDQLKAGLMDLMKDRNKAAKKEQMKEHVYLAGSTGVLTADSLGSSSDTALE